MSTQEIEERIIQYLRVEFSIDDVELCSSSDLFEDGYIQSIHLEKFFGGVEKIYSITFEEELFFDERITTISGIAEIIMEKEGIIL